MTRSGLHPLRQITLFGGTGFIGRHLVRKLAETGARIIIPTRHPDLVLPLKTCGDVGQIVALPTNIRHESAVARACAGSDAVINLIGILYEKKNQSFQCLHVETAARIARQVHDAGASQYIQMSSLGASPNAAAAYARSKFAGEEAARTFFPHATILRPSIVFGAEDQFFNLFARMAQFAPALPLIGGGQTRFQPVYVGDVAAAVMNILQNANLQGRTYALAGSEIASFSDLMQKMLSVTGQKVALVPVPWAIAYLKAFFLEWMPHPLLTRDQVTLLKTDNVLDIASGIGTLADLGVTPVTLDLALPSYLTRFRRAG
ncbi:MAG: complex I NDUFA9 subunit family protein [Alphaproteobacteria bacterium]|nr:complex I NDUFA9 subunit family protein [Alphaproteobacteria bacterium]MBV8548436.1 complex I NDUFA9 subunit family protein [Alphaproteobacteria bacterium]